MKVVVIGGSSFSTPAMFAALADCGECLADVEFELVGRSESYLKANIRAISLLHPGRSISVRAHAVEPQDSKTVLRGADVAIIQIRVGGFEGRCFDETFSLPFGVCGDEGLGPGGLSAAWRSWPIVERWLAALAEHAPEALILMVSSPLGILTRASYARFPHLRCYGVCEVPYVCLRDIYGLTGADPATSSFEYLGVNHLGWLYAVESDGRDLLSKWAKLSKRDPFPTLDIVRRYRGFPTKYLRLHFDRDLVLEEQRTSRGSRSAFLNRLRARTLAIFLTGDVQQIRDALKLRQTPWYSQAIVPLLVGLQNYRRTNPIPLFLSAPNRGYTSQMKNDDVIEIPYSVRDGKLQKATSRAAAPERIVSLVSAFCRYERLATAAIVNRAEGALSMALKQHPWIESREIACALINEIIVNANSGLAFRNRTEAIAERC